MKLFYIISLFSSLYVWSQNYSSIWYGNNTGPDLPQSTVKDIIKDKYGFIWFNTNSGVLRYDGKQFLLYKSNNLPLRGFWGNVEKDSIVMMAADSYQDATIISKRTSKDTKVKNVDASLLPRNHKIYSRFYRSNPADKYFPNVAFYYLKTNSGIYYFNNSLIEFEKQKDSKKEIVLENFHYNDLKRVFTHGDYVFITDPNKRKTMRLYQGKISYDSDATLYNDPQSKIFWYQTSEQVFIINKGNIYQSKLINGKPKLFFLVKYENVEKDFATTIFYDEAYGKLYFGTLTKGLHIINLSKFYISQKKIPFVNEVVYAALPFSKSSVITEEGIEYFKDTTRLIFPYRIAFNDNRSITYDRFKNILYQSENKIQRRFIKSGYIKKDSIVFPNTGLKSLYKRGNENMLTIFNDKSEHTYLYFFEDDSFNKNKGKMLFPSIVNTTMDINDEFFYVGCNDGLYLISVKTHKIIKKIVKGIAIKEILKTKDGNFWFTTYGKGFYLLKNNKEIKMPYDRGGYLADAHTFLEDSQSNLWISSNNGLFKVSKNKLLSYAQKKEGFVNYFRFSTEDGLTNNEFNGSSNPNANILENGEFVFPSMDGFVFFKPEEIKCHFPKPDQVFIERAEVDDIPVNFQNKLSFQSNYKTVEVYIDIPYYYSDIENIYLEAKLDDGKNNKWERIKNNRKFIITKVSPGDYNLLVRYITSEKGNFMYKKIAVTIEPKFYETHFFLMFVVLVGIGTLILIVRLRTNFLNKELKETNKTLDITKDKLKNEAEYQQKLVQSISHDIASPIKFISFLSQQLRETEDPIIQKEYFDGIYSSSEQLYKFTSGLRAYTELYKEDYVIEGEEYVLYDVIEEKVLLFRGIAKQNGTIIDNVSNQNVTTRINRDIIAAIVHNLIDNAVKHTIESNIVVSAELGDNGIEIEIKDGGSGMTKEQRDYYSDLLKKVTNEEWEFKNYGLGLHMVIQLVRKINATISFNENFPTGTVVKVVLNNTKKI
ncbi:sensor histidine kinase [Chryseobacterium nematophagum]|uniref:Sensor histidine kinase n=1 Tax=Chryseobacterium nematophagum TaxID=2305228 RepID=A0A3M7LCQ9_9FLAO|nr:HAMP domain-containing sensor histidine kinase [Chryseobacterium nematophagum]RMZ59790.1 sensor histidine kinase [Chryseobacterium nematophagum]